MIAFPIVDNRLEQRMYQVSGYWGHNNLHWTSEKQYLHYVVLIAPH